MATDPKTMGLVDAGVLGVGMTLLAFGVGYGITDGWTAASYAAAAVGVLVLVYGVVRSVAHMRTLLRDGWGDSS